LRNLELKPQFAIKSRLLRKNTLFSQNSSKRGRDSNYFENWHTGILKQKGFWRHQHAELKPVLAKTALKFLLNKRELFMGLPGRQDEVNLGLFVPLLAD
jgi:hypothetical protein